MAREHFMGAACAVAALFVVVVPSAPRAVTIRIDGASYTSSYNISASPITGASGILYGVDFPGEWAQYNLTLSAFGIYSVTVRCWGAANIPYQLKLIVEDLEQNVQVVDIAFIGKGTCGH